MKTNTANISIINKMIQHGLCGHICLLNHKKYTECIETMYNNGFNISNIVTTAVVRGNINMLYHLHMNDGATLVPSHLCAAVLSNKNTLCCFKYIFDKVDLTQVIVELRTFTQSDFTSLTIADIAFSHKKYDIFEFSHANGIQTKYCKCTTSNACLRRIGLHCTIKSNINNMARDIIGLVVSYAL